MPTDEPLTIEELGAALLREIEALPGPAEPDAGEEPTAAVHDPTPVPPQLSRAMHTLVEDLARLARAAGVEDFSLQFKPEDFARLLAELIPARREEAAHRWGGSELRVMTCNGFTRVTVDTRR